MGPPLIILFLFGAVIDVALSVPAGNLPPGQPDNIYDTKSCVVMTPEREREINSIVEKLSDFLYNMTMDYDYLDIRLVKLVVEGHYDDEVEEKETALQLLINDCVSAEQATRNKGYYTAQPDNGQIETEELKTESDATAPKITKAYPSDTTAVDTASVLVVENPDDTEVSTSLKSSPQLIRLDLDDTGEKLVKLYQVKHGNVPFLLYIRKVLGNLEYMFLN